jgi:DNA polymerase-3 subunit gamma/tau
MVIVRIAHAADLPTPDEALKQMADGGGSAPRPRSAAPASSGSAPRMAMAASGGARAAPAAAPAAAVSDAPRLATFDDLVAYAGVKRELKLKHALETTVRVARFEPGRIEIALTEHAAPGLVGELNKKLEQWTGTRWMITVVRESGAATIAEVKKSARDRLVDDARADPVVAAVMAEFPGAEIVDVRVPASEIAAVTEGEDLPPPVDEMNEDD